MYYLQSLQDSSVNLLFFNKYDEVDRDRKAAKSELASD
jgi:hypothetical protein